MPGKDPTARRVAEAVASVARRDHLLDRLQLSSRHVADLWTAAEEARRSAESEGAEVTQLEALTAHRLREMWRGTLDESLGRERDEEAAAAELAAEAAARLTAARQAHAALQDALTALGDVDEAERTALAAREQDLRARGTARADDLLRVSREIGELDGERSELAEARRAAFLVVVRVRALSTLLSDAGSWASGGHLLGGVTASSIRQDRIDEATDLSRRADTAVAALSRELGDVGVAGSGGGAFSPGAGFFTDLWVGIIAMPVTLRSRVGAARSRAEDLRDEVEDLLRRLDERLDQVAAELDHLEDRRRELLAG